MMNRERGFTHYARGLSLIYLSLFVGNTWGGQSDGDNKCVNPYERVIIRWAKRPLLPSRDEIDFIERNLPESAETLRKGLKHENFHVRLCTADVIHALGNSAKCLSTELRAAYSSEKIPFVRAYIARALGATADSTDVNVEFIRKAFGKESDGQARTALAGALIVLRGIEKENSAWKWVLDSFNSPDAEVQRSEEKLVDHWDRCFAALFVVDDLKSGTEPAEIKMIELKREQSTPEYIQQKINEVLCNRPHPKQQ